LKKRRALAILEKFKLKIRPGKENFATFYYNDKFILTTTVPKGQGDFYSVDKFRNQLRLDENQLRDAERCPFGYNEFVANLIKKGYIN